MGVTQVCSQQHLHCIGLASAVHLHCIAMHSPVWHTCSEVIAQQLQHLIRSDMTAVRCANSSCNTCSAAGKTAVKCPFSRYSKGLALRCGCGPAGVLHHTCEQDGGEGLLVPSLLSGPPRGAHRAGWHERKSLETHDSGCLLALKLRNHSANGT